MYIILSQDAKSSLRLQCGIAGNASEVAISSYTMAGWQHGSKHAEVRRQCPLSPWVQNQNQWPPFRFDVTVCDGDYEERPQLRNYCSSPTQTLFANMFNWKKNRTSATPCQNAQVWNMEDLFHSIHQIFLSVPYLSHSIFHTDFFLPLHTTVCPACRNTQLDCYGQKRIVYVVSEQNRISFGAPLGTPFENYGLNKCFYVYLSNAIDVSEQYVFEFMDPTIILCRLYVLS